MLRSFTAHNFRCFKSVELDDLRRINLVVGKNAAGKTALLEAIRLGLAGTPQVLWQMNAVRGAVNYFPQPPVREQFEAFWNSYFYNFDPTEPILTECVDSSGRQASLKVHYDPKKAVTPVPLPTGQPGAPLLNTIIPLAFDRTDFSGKHSVLLGSVHPSGPLNLENGPELGKISEFYSSTLQNNAQQTAQWFSQLSIQKRESEVVRQVVKEFGPLVRDLTVLSPNQFPAIYADVSSLKEKIPLSLISSGINKFVSILAAIMTRGGGVLLIDEIENGIYYESFPSIWKVILDLARTYQTQIFASTHSLECIRALLPSIKNNEQDVMLLRAERQNGASGVTPITGEFFEAALEQNFEVR
jgi:hypothetical protein